MNVIEIALLVAIIGLAVYCAILDRKIQRLAQRSFDIVRESTAHTEAHYTNLVSRALRQLHDIREFLGLEYQEHPATRTLVLKPTLDNSTTSSSNSVG